MVLGIRPDVIRASLMIKRLKKELGSNFIFIWSGQHYSDNMKDVFFQQLDVPRPDITLELKKTSDFEMIGDLTQKLGAVLQDIKPEAVIFLGDTNTVTSSLAAASLDIPIVHIEGCMRSYDWRMPEEKYRTTIDHLADIIYAYFDEYKNQGLLEGLEANRIIVTGNPIVDVLQEYFLSGKIRFSEKELTDYRNSLGIDSQSYWVMTAHRRENVESQSALTEILNLARSVKEPVIFPAGYRTQQQITKFNLTVPKNAKLMDPIGYIELLELVMGCTGILTDSGTLVEEAAVLGVPAIQMRTSTERPQVYDTGGCIKFDPHQMHSEDNRQKLIAATKSRHGAMDPHNLGDGLASERIVDDLLDRLNRDDWSGHKPDPKARPIDRNFGYGLSNRGKV